MYIFFHHFNNVHLRGRNYHSGKHILCVPCGCNVSVCSHFLILPFSSPPTLWLEHFQLLLPPCTILEAPPFLSLSFAAFSLTLSPCLSCLHRCMHVSVCACSACSRALRAYTKWISEKVWTQITAISYSQFISDGAYALADLLSQWHLQSRCCLLDLSSPSGYRSSSLRRALQ